MDYPTAAAAAFNDAGGRWRKWRGAAYAVIAVFLFLTQFLSNAVYVLFMAQNMQPVRRLHIFKVVSRDMVCF